MRKKLMTMAGTGLLLLAAHHPAAAGLSEATRIEALELQMQTLLGELSAKQSSIEQLQQQIEEIKTARQQAPAGAAATTPPPAPASRFSFGGYGELHANFQEGSSGTRSNDQFDIHRLVAFIGYDFADWIKFQSEIEIEHAMVSSGDGGELEIEQAYLDFLLADWANIRVGRTLVPLGIINQRHEPATFWGVERPNFAKAIIPTTWWSDGVGLFGSLTPALSYQAYVLAGLDGSQFNAGGIRGGRLKERPSYNDPAYTFRLDYFPLLNADWALGRNLRLGGSYYYSGLDNGNQGKDPGVEGDLAIYAADFEVRVADLDLRGVVALEEIDGAAALPKAGVAEEIFGYYLEAGYHFWPQAWRRGKLKEADAVAFFRYDRYDTQHEMPAGVAPDPAFDRRDYTVGLAFFPVPNLALKADYQILESEAAQAPDNQFNLGVGWQF